MNVTKRDGTQEPFDFDKVDRLNAYATSGLNIDEPALKSAVRFLVYDGMKTSEIFDAQVKAASGLISQEYPDFTYVAARYLLCDLYKRVTGTSGYSTTMPMVLSRGIANERYSPDMLVDFDFHRIESAIKPERDFKFDYFGLQNIIDRYLMRTTSKEIIELPQQFFMRVAMGMALKEGNSGQRTVRAIEFYNQLSSFDFMSSTPTLFNSGTVRSQMSSCYLNSVGDSISTEEDQPQFASIFGTIEESARLSKYAGGIGTDWNRVRGAGSLIKGTNGKSSGVVPYLKVYNDTAVAVNQGGKRKGSFAPYLQPWHPDFWDFCELKKEFGDDRMRAHDIFPAAWLCDIFMVRVRTNGVWSFFDPHEHPVLNETFGPEFDRHYTALEAEGKFKSQRPAVEVWKHILTNLFETGHPWITFKDESNRRNPQQHVGMVRSSNLCTEITLNTSDTETAVCNLGSINLANHIKDGHIDIPKLQRTVTTAVRMLDNVIDLNFYPSWRAKASNLKHRPIGLGVMGYAEAMTMCGIDWETESHLKWANAMMETVSFFAIEASADLARERGRYESFEGSLWSKNIFPMDTASSMGDISMPWVELREKVKLYGMRNSNVMAIAPTATISIITATTPTTEAPFELERWEGGMSGKFKVTDPCLRHAPASKIKTVWQIAPEWVIRSAAVRQRWIDQSQSTNIFVKAGTRGRDLAEIYMLAWTEGLKTTYYLRSQSKVVKKEEAPVVGKVEIEIEDDVSVNLCSIDNPDCESCQ